MPEKKILFRNEHIWFLEEYRKGKFAYLLEIDDEAEFWKAFYDCGDDFLCSFYPSVVQDRSFINPVSEVQTGNPRNFFFRASQVDFLKKHLDGKFSHLLEIGDIFQFKKALDDTRDNLLRRFLYATCWQNIDKHKSPLEQTPLYAGYVCVTTPQALFLERYQRGAYLYLVEIDNFPDFMKALEDIESYGDFDLRRYLGDLTYRSESIHDNVFRRSRAIDKDRDKKMRLNIDELKVELQAIAEERKRPLKRDETHEWFLREYRDGRFSYLFNKEPNEDEFNVGYSLRIKNKDLKDNFLRSFLHALSFQPLDTQSSASDLISQTRAKRNFYLTSGQVWVLNEYRRGKFSYLLAIHDKAEFLKALDDTKETFLGRLMYALAWQPMETPGTAPDSMPITGNTRNFFLNRAQINSLKDSGYFYLLEIKDGAEFRKALDALNDYYLCRRLFITSWQAMDTEETVRGRYHELRQEVLADTDESRLTATIDRSSSPYLN